MRYALLSVVATAACYASGATATGTDLAPQDPVDRQERWTWRGQIPAGRTLEIRGINGTISAEPARGDVAEVVAEKHGDDDDPRQVRIEVVEHEGGVTICAVYPGRNNVCRPRGGQMQVRDNDVEVDFTVRVPRGVLFEGVNVNGAVEAMSLEGPVELRTVNGGIRLETSSGDASAETVNGGITAVVRSVGERSLRFRTVNGGITLTLPRGLDADFEARTVNGSIDTDFPIQVLGRMNPRQLRGRIGRGGRALDLHTVNGSIRLRALP